MIPSFEMYLIEMGRADACTVGWVHGFARRKNVEWCGGEMWSEAEKRELIDVFNAVGKVIGDTSISSSTAVLAWLDQEAWIRWKVYKRLVG